MTGEQDLEPEGDDGGVVRSRIISSQPHIIVAQTDCQLSPSHPVDVRLRSYMQSPMTYYNVHPGLEVGLVLSGEEERIFSDLILPVRDGSVWLTSMWEMHGAHTSVTARVVVLTFLPEFLGELTLGGTPWLDLFVVPPSQRPQVTDDAARTQAIRIGEGIWREREQRPLGWRMGVRFHLQQLLLLLRRGWQPPAQVAAARPDRESKLSRIMPVLAAVHADPFARVSLAEAAAECGLTPRHFNRLFQQAMGVSFGKFELRTRVVAASRLLVRTDLGVEAVAEQAGFVDASHFHHTFARHYGCTPAEYRRRFRDTGSHAEADLH